MADLDEATVERLLGLLERLDATGAGEAGEGTGSAGSAPTLLDKARMAARVLTDMTDAELAGLVAAAVEDLRRVGVREELLDEASMDPLAEAAVMMYVKANYGYDNDESEIFWQRYQLTVTSLMNSSKNVCADEGSGDGT